MSDFAGLPKNTNIAKAVIDAKTNERGWIGAIVGTREHAPTNIAFIALILVTALMGVVLLVTIPDLPRSVTFPALLSVFTGIVGFLFGKSGAKD